jgi:hypothetical protein|tara:strand:- start:18573 stop:18782 length:210 start_codon:yes stop_codon:yes gene_type:complete
MKRISTVKGGVVLKSNKFQKNIGNPDMKGKTIDVEDIEYFQRNLFRALKIPNATYNSSIVQEDYYLGCR